MSRTARISAATVLGALWAALAVLTTLPLPEPLEAFFGSPLVIVWLQALVGIAAFFLLWSVAKDADQQEKIAKEALRIAGESNAALQRRVEAALEKLKAAEQKAEAAEYDVIISEVHAQINKHPWFAGTADEQESVRDQEIRRVAEWYVTPLKERLDEAITNIERLTTEGQDMQRQIAEQPDLIAKHSNDFSSQYEQRLTDVEEGLAKRDQEDGG